MKRPSSILHASIFRASIFHASVILACIAGIICVPAHAETVPGAQPGQARPKICLALSGGGARGAAHVGVLKALEQLHIPIDCIAGTSMGAVVGGLYASGMSADQIGSEMAKMDWDSVLQDAPPRPDRSFRRKQDDRANFSKGKPGVKDNRITVPPAFVLGQKFDLELNRMTLPVAKVTDFSRLRIPFRAVATDLATGQAVVLDRGNLARAMHASMAVPSAFAGVDLDDRILVDGGVANNLPIDVARQMGADIVIAVDISTPLYKKEQLGSALVVFDQLTNILTRRSADAQIATLTERDLLIAPDLKDITSSDFSKTNEAATLGQSATEAASDKLSRLSLPPASYAEYQRSHAFQPGNAPVLDFVRVDNHSKLDDALILQRLGIKPGEPLDTEKLQAGIGTVYGLGIFESVRYEIAEDGDRTGIIIHAQEKSWGTNFLQFGAELATDLNGGSSSFNLGVVYTAIPMNSLNGEWRSGVQIGEEPAIFTEWYQPLDPLSRYFVNAFISDQRQRFKVFSGDTVTAEYLLKTATAGVAVGRELGTWGEARLGYQRYHGEAEVVVGPPVLGEPNFDGGETNLRLSADTLDNVRFPQQGYAGVLQWTASRHSFGADNNFDQVSLNAAKAQSWHSNTLFGRLLLNTTLDDDAPLQNQFRLGGFTQFSGLLPNQLNGQHAGLLTAGYIRRLYNVKILTVYAGSTLELGNVWQKKSDISFNDTLTAGSVFLGVDLPIGPLYVGYGITEGNRDTLFLLLGQPWF